MSDIILQVVGENRGLAGTREPLGSVSLDRLNLPCSEARWPTFHILYKVAIPWVIWLRRSCWNKNVGIWAFKQAQVGNHVGN